MYNGSNLKQVKVNSEKLTKFQLPRSYTIDSWNVEIGISGNDGNKYLNINRESFGNNKIQQSTNYLKKIFNNSANNLNARYKLLAIIVIISIILNITALIIALQNPRRSSNLCLTNACIQAAAKSLQYLDHIIDPCNNFYDFVCGNFGKDISDAELSVSVLDKGAVLVESHLRYFFNEPIPINASKPFKYLQKMYYICSDLNKDTEEDETRRFKLLLHSLGGWPITLGNNWNENKFNWMQLIYDLRKIGVPHDYFFKIGLNVNITHYHLSIISIEKNSSYDAVIIKTLATALEGNKTIIEKDINDVMLFKAELKKKMFNKIESLNKNAVITVKELQTKCSEINWLSFLKNVLNLFELNVTENTLITVNVEDVKDLLKLILHTPKRTLSNYIFSGVVQYIISHLPKLYNRNFKQKIKIDNFKIAVTSLPLAINSWYVKKYFNPETKNHVKELLTNIKNEFKNTLQSTEWIDESTKNQAINKINAMTASIGYPEELINETILESFYDKLEINFSSCLEAAISANKFNVDSNFKKLDLALSKDWTEIGADVTDVNAYYSVQTNNIVIPTAFILHSMYDKDYPNYLSYATLGYLIGHEITHGFDNIGSKYDLNGNMNNWWSPETSKTFEQKTQCMVEQYQNFTMFNISINGSLTLSENIADNNGLKQAYKAYQISIKANNNEQKLPGLNFTENQMFWILYAQSWCEKLTESYIRQYAQYDSHAPQRYRITGTLSNLESFAKDFNCPVGAPMNPNKKCIVW